MMRSEAMIFVAAEAIVRCQAASPFWDARFFHDDTGIDRFLEPGIMARSAGHMPIPEPSNVFTFEGALDLHVSPSVRASLDSMIDKKPKRLVVDLSRTTYIDSSGLAVLVSAMQRLEQDGGLLMLAGVSDSVRVILESARLDQYFLTFPNVDVALAAV